MHDPLAICGRRIGPFKVAEFLGAGSMASVYRAAPATSRGRAAYGAEVALKFLHPEFAERAPSFIARFRREAKVGLAIDHPAVIRCYASGKARIAGHTHYYLVLELLTGQSLRQLFVELRKLPEPLLRSIGAQVASGLDAVHRAGAVHRDVKPDNIWITESQQVKVTDLGVSHLLAERGRLTSYGHFVGSILYAAPEQLDDTPLTIAADLYALGLVLHEAATGSPPFAADTFEGVLRRRAEHVPERLAAIGRGLSPLLDEVVATLLARDPGDRFVSAAAVAEVMEQGEQSTWWQRRCRAAAPGDRPSQFVIPIARQVRFYGREAELTPLTAAYRRACTGDGQSTLLVGEAGIGKSRLLAELVDRVSHETTLILYGSCMRATGQSGQAGLTRPLLSYFGPVDVDRRVARLLERHGRIAAILSAILGGRAPETTAPMTTPVAVSRQSLRAIVEALADAVTTTRTLVWIVEDLHLANDDDREVVRALAAAASGRRMLMIASSRPTSNGDWPEFTQLPIGPLSQEAAGDLMAAVLPADIDTTRRRRFLVRGDGNPFFLLELARHSETNSEPHRGGARGSQEAASVLPPTVRDLVTQRLQSLPPDSRLVLDIAAVLGYQFDSQLLARVLGRPPLLVLRILADLERRSGIVRAVGNSFQFDHHVVQEALYTNISASRRCELHGRVADTADGFRTGSTAGEKALFMAEHYLYADRMNAATPWLVPALAHLGAKRELHAQLDLSTLALQQPSGDCAVRADLLRVQVRCLRILGRRGELESPIVTALEAANESGDPCRIAYALREMASHQQALGAIGDARTLARRAVAAARKSQNAEAEVLCLITLAHLDLRHGRLNIARAGYQAAHRAARQRFPYLARQAAMDLAQVELHRSRYATAQRAITRWLPSFAADPDPQLEAIAFGNLGLAFLHMGRWQRARRAFDHGLEVAREFGLRSAEVSLVGNLGCVHGHLGDLDLARRAFTRQVELAVETVTRERESQGQLNLAIVSIAEGRLLDARDNLDQAQNALPAGSVFFDACRHSVDADLAFALRDWQRAQSLAGAALDLLADHSGPWRERTLISLGRAALFDGNVAAARSAFVAAIDNQSNDFPRDPRPLAYLALLGTGDAAAVDVGRGAPTQYRAEAHQILGQAGVARHRRRAQALLDTLSRHLEGGARDRFKRSSLFAGLAGLAERSASGR